METRLDVLETPTSAKIAKRFYATSLILQQSTLPRSVQELVQLRASQINGCGFCLDAHVKEAAAAGESPVRLSLVAAWRHTTVFTPAERAVLAFTEEGTRLADAGQGVSDATWAELRGHFDDDQLGALVWLVGLINATNRVGVILNSLGGGYEPGMLAALD